MSSDTLLRGRIASSLWVWLDLDDTVIDFRANSREALHIIYGACGLDRYFPSVGEWTEAYLRHNHRLWDLYNKGDVTQAHLRLHRFLDPLGEVADAADPAVRGLAEGLDGVYLDILAERRNMVPGAVELMRHLRAGGYRVGILSNGFTGVQNRKMDVNGLRELTDLLVLSDDIGVNKPDPRLFRHAMERAGEPDPRRHTMIGDNPSTDILGAVRAGWNAILYAPGGAVLPEGVRGDEIVVSGRLEGLCGLFSPSESV